MDQMLSGPYISRKIQEMIENAENHIYIMQFLLFDVKKICSHDLNLKLNLIDCLIKKIESNIEIKIIISNPKGFEKEIRKKQFESIEKIALNKIPLMLCDQVHYKFLLVDDGLLHGSANFTYTGLAGKRDEMVYTENDNLIREFTTLFLKRWSLTGNSCLKCEKKCKKFL